MRFALPFAALALVTACGEPDYLQTPVDPMPQPAPAMAPAPQAGVAPSPSGISTSDLNSALYGNSAPAAAAPTTMPAVAPAPVPAGAPAGVYPSVAPLPPDTPNPEAIYGHAINTPDAPSQAQQQAAADATSNAGISDEQDFQAVSARETIESDKARIDANKAQYEQIQPTALPERTDEETAAVIQYVLTATNAKGQSIYGRRTVSEEKYQKACQNFITGVAAQAAFLKAGGPDRDPKRLDPDGDGYACDFDPTPFRAGAGN